jgi:hypothetical protein
METALVLSATALGLIATAMLGNRSGAKKPPGGWGAALGISVCTSIATVFVANYLVVGCTSLGVCRRLTDTDLGLALAPIFAFPIYWLVAGMSSRVRRSESTTSAAAADAATIASALASFRSGTSIAEVCPSCGIFLVVKPAKPKPGRDVGALRLTCECGASNGTYVMNESSA